MTREVISADGLSQAAQRKLPVTANAKRLSLNCSGNIAAMRSTFEATPGCANRRMPYSLAHFGNAVKRELCRMAAIVLQSILRLARAGRFARDSDRQP